MKKLFSFLLSILIFCMMCSCEKLFKNPPENQLTDNDFIFADMDGEDNLRIELNQYLYIINGSAYYHNLATEKDMTINTNISTGRNIYYNSPLQTFYDAYEVESGFAAWDVISYDAEDENAPAAENKLVYNAETPEQLSAKFEDAVSKVNLCIGYYQDADSKKWLKLTGEELIKITNGDRSYKKDHYKEIVLIAIDISSEMTVNELCFYYTDAEKILEVFN